VAIGIIGGKTPANVGTLWRTAHSFGAAYVFTVGARYDRQPSDTSDATKHVPLMAYADLVDFAEHLPHDVTLVGIECGDDASRPPKPLATFPHPERAVYFLGAEDTGLPTVSQTLCDTLIAIPGDLCLDVAVAGSIVLYDRIRGTR
jgi:tRNA G18 (ribose-2'-O)-methylase SpoU